MNTDYVLITPARNEAVFIAKTIESVIAQTLLPQKWVIVSDGSTDGTDEIVAKYLDQHAWMKLLRLDRDGARDFGRKVFAIRAGHQQLTDIPYVFLGNLDADVSFGPNYFATLLDKFHQNPRLGIAGGVTFDFYNGRPHRRHASVDSVGGAVQLFRRECYEAIGGYLPLRCGSEDAVAIHMARWKGWETRSFPELAVMHHRKTGTAGQSIWRTRFHQGTTQYAMGWTPSFILLRALYRSIERPYVFGALTRTIGYLWAGIRRHERVLSPELLRFIRDEQRGKLLDAVRGKWRPWKC